MIGLSTELISKGRLDTDLSGDVSSVGPSLEQIKELWVVRVYIVSSGAMLLVGAW